jgi:thiol:disulfide interchange protein
MRSFLLLVAVLLLSWNANAQQNKTSEVSFYSSTWADVLQKAKRENKIIFLDGYTTWCAPCKNLKKKTFTDKTVAEYFNKNFLNVMFDMEKGEGLMLAKKYKIESYPTLLFLKPDGTIIKTSVGFLTPKELMNIAKSI